MYEVTHTGVISPSRDPSNNLTTWYIIHEFSGEISPESASARARTVDLKGGSKRKISRKSYYRREFDFREDGQRRPGEEKRKETTPRIIWKETLENCRASECISFGARLLFSLSSFAFSLSIFAVSYCLPHTYTHNVFTYFSKRGFFIRGPLSRRLRRSMKKELWFFVRRKMYKRYIWARYYYTLIHHFNYIWLYIFVHNKISYYI